MISLHSPVGFWALRGCGAALLLLSACRSSPEARREHTFFPDPPAPPRIQFLTSFSSSEDIEPGPSGLDEFLFGESQVKKEIGAPYGVAWRDGSILACDVQRGSVLILDLDRRLLTEFGRTGRGKLSKPINLHVDPEERCYVADADRNQVVVFDAGNEYLREYGPWEGGRCVDTHVRGNELYVCDNKLAEVRAVSLKTGEVIRTYGRTPRSLRSPTNIALDRAGNLFVVDTVACQVLVYGPNTDLLRHLGSPGDVIGQFARPKGICLDPEDRVYVVDAAFENCQVFDPGDRVLMFFGGPGAEPGSLYLPADVEFFSSGLDRFKSWMDPSFHAEGIILISNLFGSSKINVYALGKSDQFQYPEDRVEENASP
jgi:hypothetical protein